MNSDATESGEKAVGRWPHLKELRKAGDVDALLRELDSPEETSFESSGETFHFTVCGEAARQLGYLQDSRAVLPIGELLKDSRFMVRAEAAKALGAIGDQAAVPLLIEALGDEHDSVRYRAAESLGYLGDGKAGSALTETLEDQNPRVRLVAARALAKLGFRQAIRPMQQAIRREGFAHPYRSLRLSLALLALRFRRA